MLLTGCSWLTQLAVLHSPGPPVGTEPTTTSVPNQEDARRTCPRASLVEAFSQLKFHLPNDPSLCLGDRAKQLAYLPFAYF